MRAALGIADGAGEPILEDGAAGALGPVDVDLGSNSPDTMIDGALRTENSDGSASFEFNPAAASDDPEVNFDANLAKFLSESDRDGIAQEIIEAVEKDKESRAEWAGALADGIKLLGLRVEDRTVPFKGACGVYDSIMAEATIRFQAMWRGEMMPALGPVKTEIIGLDTDENRDRSYRVKEFFNLYLTQLAPEYYPDMDQMGTWLPLVGSTFKKVDQDPILGRPTAPFITPDKFIVPYTASDLQTTPRATQEFELSYRQMRERQLAGVFIDAPLGEPGTLGNEDPGPIAETVDSTMGITPTIYRGDSQFTLYESHADLDLPGFRHKDHTKAETGLPLPFRITVDTKTKKCLAIYRNWRQADERFRKRQFYVHYKFIPGLGFYGWGYAHILGGTAKTGTMIRRQLIDAGTLASFPGGLRVKGMRVEDNNIGVGPCEFREIDTAGLPIQQAVMAFPYKGADPVSLELLKENTESGRSLASTAEMAVGEGRQDAPVGTTVALLEAATRVQSAVLKRSHQAFGQELRLMSWLFGQYLPEKPYPFAVRGQQMTIMRADFAGHIDVLPVSDPNITSSAQRMARAEALLRTAMQAPQIHDLREAYRNLYTEMGVPAEKIDQLMPQPAQAQPLDPLTENQNALMNRPLAAAPWQDHDAHMAAHQPLAEQIPEMQAHVAEHMAMKMRAQVEAILGIQLPPLGAQLPPQIQNQIAALVAKAMQAIKAQQPGANEPSPGQIMLDQLQVEAQKVAERAKEALIRAATEKYKTDMKFRSDMAQLQSDERVAHLKAFAATADNQTSPPSFATRLLTTNR